MAQPEQMQESAWNMARAYMMRLDFILQNMNMCAITEDYFGWWKWTRTLFQELSPKMTSAQREKNMKIIDDLEKKIKLIETNSARAHIRNPNYTILYPTLLKWDIELRGNMEQLKLITPVKDSPGFAVGSD